MQLQKRWHNALQRETLCAVCGVLHHLHDTHTPVAISMDVGPVAGAPMQRHAVAAVSQWHKPGSRLHAACMAGDVGLTEALLRRMTYAQRRRALRTRDSCGREPWECAALSGSWDVLRLCLCTVGPPGGQPCTPVTAFSAAWRACQPTLCLRLLSMLPRGWFESHARELLPTLVLKRRGCDMLRTVVLPTFGPRLLLKASGVVSLLLAAAIDKPWYLPPVDMLRIVLGYPVAAELLRMARVGEAPRGCVPLHKAMDHRDDCLPLLRVLLPWLQQRGDVEALRAGDCLTAAVRGGSVDVVRFVAQFSVVWDAALPRWSRDGRLDAVTACFTRTALTRRGAADMAHALAESPHAAGRVRLGAYTSPSRKETLATMACAFAPSVDVLGAMLRIPGVCGQWPSRDDGARALTVALMRSDRVWEPLARCAFHFDEGLGFATLTRPAQRKLLASLLFAHPYSPIVPYMLRQPCAWDAWCDLLAASAEVAAPVPLGIAIFVHGTPVQSDIMDFAARARRWKRRRCLLMLRLQRDAGRSRPLTRSALEPHCLAAWFRARQAPAVRCERARKRRRTRSSR